MIEKIEYHCHTSRSFDSQDDLLTKISLYKDLEFTKVYITDHDEVLEKKFISDITRPGIEVSSTFGHIILLECTRKPIINSLWFLVLWARLYNSTILIPHPFRKYTGLLERYYSRGFSINYLNWFVRNTKLIEHYNHRDKPGYNSIVKQSTLQIIKSLDGIYSSDSHSLTDIYQNGTFKKDAKVKIDKKLSSDFFKKIQIMPTRKKVNFLKKIYFFTLSARRVMIYILYGRL